MFHVHRTLWERVQRSVRLNVLNKLDRATELELFEHETVGSCRRPTPSSYDQGTGRLCLGHITEKHVVMMGSSHIRLSAVLLHVKAFVCRLVVGFKSEQLRV